MVNERYSSTVQWIGQTRIKKIDTLIYYPLGWLVLCRTHDSDRSTMVSARLFLGTLGTITYLVMLVLQRGPYKTELYLPL